MKEQAPASLTDLKEQAIASLTGRYEKIIEIIDGFTEGKATLEDWQLEGVSPPLYRSKEDLIQRFRYHITGAEKLARDLGIVTPQEARVLNRRYRSKRPDIFWPYEWSEPLKAEDIAVPADNVTAPDRE